MRLVSPETLDRPSTSAMPSGDNFNQAGSSGSASRPAFALPNLPNEEPESSLRKRLADSMSSRSNSDTKSVKKRRTGKDKSYNMVLSWAFSEIETGTSYSSFNLNGRMLCIDY